jgi:hypothetical protein
MGAVPVVSMKPSRQLARLLHGILFYEIVPPDSVALHARGKNLVIVGRKTKTVGRLLA